MKSAYRKVAECQSDHLRAVHNQNRFAFLGTTDTSTILPHRNATAPTNDQTRGLQRGKGWWLKTERSYEEQQPLPKQLSYSYVIYA